MASNQRGSGRFGMNSTPASDEKDGTADGMDERENSAEGTVGRPTCLAPPSPPNMPFKKVLGGEKTLPDSAVDLAFARFEAQCTVTEAAPPGERVAKPPGVPIEIILMPDEALERTAQGWIQAVTGQPFMSYGTDGFARNIKSGERLCNLVNNIRPGTIPHVHKSHLGYEQMENVDNFITACCKLGVPNHFLINKIDVFEMKDTRAVVTCVHALASVIQTSCPEYRGPKLGSAADPSLVAAVPSVREERASPLGLNEAGRDMRTEDYHTTSSIRDDRLYGGWFDKEGAGKNSNDVTPDQMPTLNMQDVVRPRSVRRGFNTTVGSVSDLRAPAPLSARACKMCPEEMVNSPRALAYDTDPIGHPPRSPAAETSTELALGGVGLGTNLGSKGRSNRHWGAEGRPISLGPMTPSSNLWSSPSLSQTLSPAGLWATTAGGEATWGSNTKACHDGRPGPSSLGFSTPQQEKVGGSFTGNAAPMEEAGREVESGGGGGNVTAGVTAGLDAQDPNEDTKEEETRKEEKRPGRGGGPRERSA